VDDLWGKQHVVSQYKELSEPAQTDDQVEAGHACDGAVYLSMFASVI